MDRGAGELHGRGLHPEGPPHDGGGQHSVNKGNQGSKILIKFIILYIVQVIKNKFTGGAAGYGFINFISDQVALTCMPKLNGKIMPNTNPPIRYNHSQGVIFPVGALALPTEKTQNSHLI